MGGIIFAVVVLILFFGMMSANGKKKEKVYKTHAFERISKYGIRI